MKLLVLQETDWIKRGPHQQHHLMDRMVLFLAISERRGLEHFILHTRQRYSYNRDKVFFEQVELPEERYKLEVGSEAHGEQTGRIMECASHMLSKSNGWKNPFGDI